MPSRWPAVTLVALFFIFPVLGCPKKKSTSTQKDSNSERDSATQKDRKVQKIKELFARLKKAHREEDRQGIINCFAYPSNQFIKSYYKMKDVTDQLRKLVMEKFGPDTLVKAQNQGLLLPNQSRKSLIEPGTEFQIAEIEIGQKETAAKISIGKEKEETMIFRHQLRSTKDGWKIASVWPEEMFRKDRNKREIREMYIKLSESYEKMTKEIKTLMGQIKSGRIKKDQFIGQFQKLQRKVFQDLFMDGKR